MRTFSIIALIVTFVGFSSAQDVTNSSFKLNEYKTFGFTPDDLAFLNSHLNAERGIERVKTAIKNQMEEAGIKLSDNPQLLLNLGISVQEKVQTRETNIHDMHYMGQRNYHWQVDEIQIGTYEEGTLKIDFVNMADNELVNQAIVSEVLTDNDKKMEKRINKVIQKLFKKLN